MQSDIKHWPFTVSPNEHGVPVITVNYKGEDKARARHSPGRNLSLSAPAQTFTAEQISAMILGKMRDVAVSFLGRDVTDAVVTVPGAPRHPLSSTLL